MSAFETLELKTLTKFKSLPNQLALVKRDSLNGSNDFFTRLMQTSFSVIGRVCKSSSVEDLKSILNEDIPSNLQVDPFYPLWIKDMASVCDIFCEMVGEDAIGFCLGTERGCRRYHIDNVPLRLLVTYAGRGSEWLPDVAADRQAFESGMANEFILKDPSARQFAGLWDVAVFRGGPAGLLHRTPDAALDGPSILMRLDREDFWRNVLAQSQDNSEVQMAVK